MSNKQELNVRDVGIPMAPDSDLLRGRVTGLTTTPATAVELGDDENEWGGYAAEAIFDNENFEDPRHEMGVDELCVHAPTFRLLRCQSCDFEDGEVEKLVASPMFEGVEFLDLRRNHRSPDDATMAAIVASGRLSHLRFLSLDSCYQVGDATLKAIGAGAMPKLEGLVIGSTDITDEGLMALADVSKTPALVVLLGLFIPKITEEGVEALADARPNLRIQLSIG
ncbi:MAG: hypothetical protein JKY37_21555 [Nannocystaceae bacterium]|nr:hypothetical protein [Nannocystaceae bacterium]